jgi:hypothetical protein
MLAALRAKFSTHAGPRALLLSTCDLPPPQPLGATSADTSSAPALAGAAASPVGAAFAAGGSAASGGGVATAPALPQVAALPPSCSALQNRLVEASPHDYFWGAVSTCIRRISVAMSVVMCTVSNWSGDSEHLVDLG